MQFFPDSFESRIQAGPLIIMEIIQRMKAKAAAINVIPSAAAIAENINPISPNILYEIINNY